MSDQGWGHPLRTRKAHFFIDGVSLCGAVHYGGPLEEGHTLPSDCARCAKALRRHPDPGPFLGTLVTTSRSVTFTWRSEVRH